MNPRDAVFALMMLALTACAVPEESTSGWVEALDRREIEAAPTPEEEAELEELIAAADRLLARRDYQPALDTVDAALARARTAKWANRLRVLRFQIKQRMLGETCIDAFVRLDGERAVAGEVVEGDVVLLNISREPVLIEAEVEIPNPEPRGEPVVTRSLLRRSTKYVEFVSDGTVATNVDAMSVVLDRDVELEPGQAYRIPIALDTSLRVEGTMLRRYELTCTLHAARVHVGDEIFNEELVFRPAVVDVYPRNYEHLADRPLARVDQAYERQSALHLPLAASLVPERERDRLLARLGRALRDPNLPVAMRDATVSALQIVSGADPTGGPGGWIGWLRAHGH